MSTYLLINAAIICIPFLLLFERKVAYYSKLPKLFAAIAVIGPFYIIWDIKAAGRGDWTFNSEHLMGYYLLDLPVEELLFFITVPFSCIFIFESLGVYILDRRLQVSRIPFFILGTFCGALAIILSDRAYTSTVLIYTAVYFLIAASFFFAFLRLTVYWVYILITFIPFFLFNSILTSLPVVSYNPEVIVGVRFHTIPLEDFIYSFSLLSFYGMTFYTIQRKWPGKRSRS